MSNFVERKAVFKGMTLDQMKKAYSKMTAKERGQYAGAFVRAAKTAKKPTKGSSGQRSTTTKSTKPAPVQPAKNKGNTGSGRDGRPGTGTYGSQLPSNPQLKSQTKPKPKSKVQRAVDAATKPRNRRGSGVRRTGKKGINLRKLVDKVGKKLVHKKGDIKKVGGITYRHDGKRFVRYTM